MFLPAAVHASLDWPHREVARSAEFGADRAEATFPFINSGTTPITITSVTTSCGCTTAALEKKTYAPGEGGEIKASFNIGYRTGEQVKPITVRTDDPEQPVVTLTMK